MSHTHPFLNLKVQTYHPFHIVDGSPWPLTGSLGSFYLLTGIARCLHKFDNNLILLGALIISFTVVQWWRDIWRESTLQGKHTIKVEAGIRLGIILFIVREVFFFFGFFWAHFHSSLSPHVEIKEWPPIGVSTAQPLEVPLLNTVLLLSSGARLTWGHAAIINSIRFEAHIRLGATMTLAILFSFLQAIEFDYCAFSLSDSVYGRTFYLATGFHGLHVLIGALFIVSIWRRLYGCHLRGDHHFGFEARAWYWHFVDVVWLFLFVSIYWWGS